MIVLQVKELTKYYGAHNIFEKITFALNEGEKVGLIGVNGTGKSTILKCLTGEETYDSGEIFISDQTSIGFLAQHNMWRTDFSLFDELLLGFEEILEDRAKLREIEKSMSQVSDDKLQEVMEQYAIVTERYERAGGYSCETMVKRVAKGLGFKDEELLQSVEKMSGGQKTRAALARVLLSQPDILILDEPTNNLDINAVEWLEDFIRQYPKTVLLVSHDRYFLDRTANKILELEHGKIASYNENYSGFLMRKSEHLESYQRIYNKQQQVIAKTEEFIRRYKAGVKSKQARGREKHLEKMERLEKPMEQRAIHLLPLSPVAESGYSVLEMHQISHSYGEKSVLNNLEFAITKNEKVALVGENGTGKSTILKLVMGEIAPQMGQAKIGSRVDIGYFSQEHENLNWHNTVLDEIRLSFNKGEEESRKLLSNFLFQGEDLEKKVSNLSGGERARLALLKLLLIGANFLVLDEPTNHLDIPSKEVLEDYLCDFSGTILVVSHDRYFLDKVVDRVVELADGDLTDYPGNYSYYSFKKKELASEIVIKKKSEQKTFNRSPQKELERDLKKLTKKINELEIKLEELETRKSKYEMVMSDPANYEDGENTKVIVAEYDQLEEEIAVTYSEWEMLFEEQENIIKQIDKA